MKSSALFALALLAWMTGARCVQAADEERVLPLFYARDERTEIALSPVDGGGAGFEFRT